MKIRKKAALILAVTATLIGLAAVPAHATGIPSICGNGGTGYCLNAWNGGGQGGQVRMYQGGSLNDGYEVIYLSLMCHDGRVHASAPYGPCPFENGTGLNTQMNGAALVAIRDTRNGLCVGTTSSTLGTVEVTCPDALGNNGGWGVIQAESASSGCNAANKEFFENRYWSNAYDTLASLQSGGNSGIQATFTPNTSQATCWGQVST